MKTVSKAWGKFRREDGSIDLISAWKAECILVYVDSPGLTYLTMVESYQPIRSRQVAAVALAQADYIHILKTNK